MQKLVITFVPKEQLDLHISNITTQYKVLFGKMYIFESSTIESEYLISYNVDIESNQNLYDNTMVCHRRKGDESPPITTLYTMNGLNELRNQLGENINWSLYDKSLILVRNNELTILKNNLVKIYEI